MTDGRTLSTARVAGRAAFAAMLAELVQEKMTQGVALIPRWRKRLVLSDSAVRHWLDPTRIRAPLTCGDVHAFDPESRKWLLERWLEHCDAAAEPPTPARSPEYEVLFVLGRLGEAADVAARAVTAALARIDRVVPAAEWLRVEQALETVERVARRGRLAARAARLLVPR